MPGKECVRRHVDNGKAGSFQRIKIEKYWYIRLETKSYMARYRLDFIFGLSTMNRDLRATTRKEEKRRPIMKLLNVDIQYSLSFKKGNGSYKPEVTGAQFNESAALKTKRPDQIPGSNSSITPVNVDVGVHLRNEVISRSDIVLLAGISHARRDLKSR